MQPLRVMTPGGPPTDPRYQPFYRANEQWRTSTGRWTPVFVIDVAHVVPDDRADFIKRLFLDCGFELVQHECPDDVGSALEGFRASSARVALICARGGGESATVRPFVLALEDADYIYVTGERPDVNTMPEGDPGSRGYYIGPEDGDAHPEWNMRFLLCGLGIMHPGP